MTDKPEIQVFEIQARPLAIPPALVSMKPNLEIRLIDRVGGVNGESLCTAWDYLVQLETTIARQAQGFLTVAEAAQSLEDAELGVVAKDMKREILNAFHVDKLVIRNPGDKMPARAKDTVLDFIHLVKISDVNAWLENQGVSYRLNVAAPAQNTATPAPVVAGGKKWTDEKLTELKTYREAHTMPETAVKFGISEQRIRELLPSEKAKAKPFAGRTHRMK